MTDPAEFVEAEATSHVVTAHAPLNHRLAHWAERYIFLHTVGSLKYPFHVLLAGCALMPRVFALEAYFRIAFDACNKFYCIAIGNDFAIAARFGAIA